MVVDGGGNRAEGNKELLQCFMIRCDGTATRCSRRSRRRRRSPRARRSSSPIDSATFEFTGADNSLIEVEFECRLDGGAWQACASPHSYSNLRRATTCSRCARSTTPATRDPSPGAAASGTRPPLPPGVAPQTTIDAGPDAVTVEHDRDASRSPSNEPGRDVPVQPRQRRFGGLRPAQGLHGLTLGSTASAVARPRRRGPHATARPPRTSGRSAPAAGGRRRQLRPGADQSILRHQLAVRLPGRRPGDRRGRHHGRPRRAHDRRRRRRRRGHPQPAASTTSPSRTASSRSSTRRGRRPERRRRRHRA